MSLKHFQFSSERQRCCSPAMPGPPIPSLLGASRELVMIPENKGVPSSLDNQVAGAPTACGMLGSGGTPRP